SPSSAKPSRFAGSAPAAASRSLANLGRPLSAPGGPTEIKLEHPSHQFHGAVAGGQRFRLDFLRREPADSGMAVALAHFALPRAPVQHDANEREVKPHAIVVIAVDVVVGGEDAQSRSIDACLLQELALGAMRDGLAQLQAAA